MTTLVKRLRSCLRFDAPEPTESELEKNAREAADRIEELEYVARMAQKVLESLELADDDDEEWYGCIKALRAALEGSE